MGFMWKFDGLCVEIWDFVRDLCGVCVGFA